MAENAKTEKKTNKVLKIFIIILIILIATGIGIGAYIYSVVESETFFKGVRINGVDISNLTKQEARNKFDEYTQSMLNEIELTLKYGDKVWKYDATTINASYNVEEVVNQAWQIGRTGSLLQNFKQIKQVETEGADFELSYSYTDNKLQDEIKKIAKEINTDPINAEVSFKEPGDKKGDVVFEFVESATGVGMHTDEAVSEMLKQIEEKQYEVYTIPFEVLEPTVTTDEVKSWTKELGFYKTKLSNNPDRTHNVKLSSSSYDGITLMPGETFSLNESTGPRGLEDGYLNAHVIQDGIRYVDAPGGGNCQTSTTLYGAVVRSNLQITERAPHSIPSSYTGLGQDATVNYPYADFKFTNNTDAPIFVDRYFTRSGGYDWINVRVYGKQSDEWDKIDLITKQVKIGDVPPVTYKADPNFTAGQVNDEASYKSRAYKKAETYRVYYKDGVEVKRILEDVSIYKEKHGVTYVGTRMPDGRIISLEEAKIAAGLVAAPARPAE